MRILQPEFTLANMKRLLSLIFLCGMIIGAFAQKSYVTVYCKQDKDNFIILSGDVPSTMKKEYLPMNDFHCYNGKDCIGEVLNLLAENGFTVEQMNSSLDSYNASSSSLVTVFLLSRPVTPSNAVQRVATDEAVTEVARYNLQGIPISAKEKGIQIVVYSNYTTRTIIVE